jgi:hypothetical protein
MRKYSLVLIVAFIAILNSFQAKANCPSWATNYYTYSFTVNGCDYTAQVCWTCPINQSQAWITIDWPIPDDANCTPYPFLNLAGIKRAILGQLSDPAWLYQLCSDYPFPQCESTTYTYKIIDYNCSYMYRNPYTHNIDYIICNYDGWCEQEWYICWDNFGPHKHQISDWTHQGSTGCSTVMPGIPILDGHSSTCWQYPLCN